MNKKILFIQPTIYDDEGKLLKKNKKPRELLAVLTYLSDYFTVTPVM